MTKPVEIMNDYNIEKIQKIRRNPKLTEDDSAFKKFVSTSKEVRARSSFTFKHTNETEGKEAISKFKKY